MVDGFYRKTLLFMGFFDFPSGRLGSKVVSAIQAMKSG
jgi:hypothetical protein